MESLRQERTNSEIIKRLSVIIRDKINDPRLANQFITLTYVKTSADFRHCKVGFNLLGNANKKEIENLLNKCEGFIKKELINSIKLPCAPKLEFILDLGSDNSERINDILKTLVIPEKTEEENDDLDEYLDD